MEDHHIAVVAHLPAEPFWVQIDRSRLRQVLLNLLNNSREAVGKGGRIEIDLTRAHGMLDLVVADNGPGVPEAQHQRIFEPFYSTKEVGIGLGLALVKKFVDESGGSIAYEPGRKRAEADLSSDCPRYLPFWSNKRLCRGIQSERTGG